MLVCPTIERSLEEAFLSICPTIVLASQSPNRRALLEHTGATVITRPQDIVEICGFTEPAKVVTTLASQKLESYLKSPTFAPSLPAIGIDTLVSLNGKLLGKPHSYDEAFEMLRSLSGRSHEVYSGLSVYNPKTQRTTTVCDVSFVIFKDLSDSDIRWYIGTGDPNGAAGAYKIQSHGYKIIESIEGSFSNIIGLPLEKLIEILK